MRRIDFLLIKFGVFLKRKPDFLVRNRYFLPRKPDCLPRKLYFLQKDRDFFIKKTVLFLTQNRLLFTKRNKHASKTIPKTSPVFLKKNSPTNCLFIYVTIYLSNTQHYLKTFTVLTYPFFLVGSKFLTNSLLPKKEKRGEEENSSLRENFHFHEETLSLGFLSA